ncbi:TonB-dependent receptor domain-containing protein [Brevundimonas pondensis]|uniref:TonB-dependent receptor n=1 Tax=Brevundimonas pondensis TaxID=2774189 RepID=A0ABX7SQE1_9CAUL|nr:TonB-dependent receptor [Brevundimonas pondensis]QTC88668.1 TonB-dependent receptor [Brevundimonas pondensis]
MRAAFTRRNLKTAMLATTALFSAATAAAAQDAPEPEATQVDEIVVVGSQIRGAKVTAALPVTVVGEEQILASAATSGDDLIRSIPQMGDVTFNSSYLPASSNSARGDTGSVNLRGLGIGNTLVLLNGRRVVGHPTSQANEHLVPVLTYNTNAIPVTGLRRLEVLRDGAAAIYGADAVAGVINTVLRDDLNGLTVSAQYGGAEGTGMRETNFSAYGGRDFLDGRANLSAFLNYDQRTELSTTDQDYTASLDKRPLFAGTGYEGNTSLNGRSSLTPWGLFRPTGGTVRLPGATSNLTAFSTQPSSFTGCGAALGSGLCLKSGTTVDSRLYSDSAAQGLTVMPEVERLNVFVTGKYRLNDSVEAFGELGYYHAETTAWQAPISTLSSIVLTIPKTNYYNPFGATTLPGGAPNPNRLPGITAPAAGVDLLLSGYRFDDLGPIEVNVTNKQYRILGGLRGEFAGWDWESALLYSEASAEDISDNISTTALQRQLALSTPDAYNPFNGGDLNNPAFGDGAPSSQAALDAIRQKMRRYTETTLALWDFKVSRPDLFTLPAGDLGMAAGIEARLETQLDDRDPRIDGTITFTDVSGAVYGDLINSSMNPDTKGDRNVYSAYAELAVPIVSPEMNIPFVHNLEAQIAGRYEHYSDFGDIAKPKVAVAWDLAEGLRLRGSWAQGFRAPNLEQINASIVTRSNSSTDWAYCEALARRGAITGLNRCVSPTIASGFPDASSVNTARIRRNVAEQRAGNPNLKPEESETMSFGTVIQPDFTPAHLGDFTITVDWWNVKQEGMVGVFRGQNALTLDYLLRKQGSFNPNVVRAAATPEDIAIFAGTGMQAAGEILYVKDLYDNLQPQEVQGIDLGLMWSLRGTALGDFSANLNVSHLLKYYLEPSPAVQALMDAKAKGDIDAAIAFSGSAGDLIRQGGRPEWKWSASATWRRQNVTVGAYTAYTGSVEQDGLTNTLGEAWTVDSQITANLYGEYEFDNDGLLGGTAVRLGVRNLTDEAPPLASDGYLGTVYQPYGRYWYASIRKSF